MSDPQIPAQTMTANQGTKPYKGLAMAAFVMLGGAARVRNQPTAPLGRKSH